MRYFVTGATGFLGGHLVEQLLDADHEVVALVRPSSAARDLPDAVEVAEGDITDRATLREPMRDVDGVFHLAAWYRLGALDEDPATRINVAGTRNVLTVADELDVPRIVYTSTLAVFSDTGGTIVDETYRHEGDHLTTYDRSKWRAHYEVVEPMAQEGVPVVTVMPGVIYGPGARGPLWELWRPYLERDLPAIPRKTGFCWSNVKDTADAHIRAMERGTPGEEYIIAGSPLTLVEAFAIAEEATGIPAPRSVPPWVFGGLARLAGLVHPTVTLPLRYRPESLRVLAGVTYWGHNGKATRELGIEHRPVEVGLAETLRRERRELPSAVDRS